MKTSLDHSLTIWSRIPDNILYPERRRFTMRRRPDCFRRSPSAMFAGSSCARRNASPVCSCNRFRTIPWIKLSTVGFTATNAAVIWVSDNATLCPGSANPKLLESWPETGAVPPSGYTPGNQG